MIHDTTLTMLAGIKPGEIIGFTSGCFDLLHALHIEYLNRCKKQCDHLFVMVDSDQLMYANKKKTPVINQSDRAFSIDNLKAVDGTVIIDNIEDIRVILTEVIVQVYGKNPVVMFKNSIRIYGANLIEVQGVDNIIIPDVNRFSSTTEISAYLKSIE